MPSPPPRRATPSSSPRRAPAGISSRATRSAAIDSRRRLGRFARRRAPVADRSVARRTRSVASGSHLRLVRTSDLMRPAPTRAAVARRNLTLLLAPTALLTVIGLVMILSAGSISAVEGYGTSFWYFNRQTLYAAAGVVGLVVCARLPYVFWRRAAIP